eukprot:3816657-Pyramimonas_sp.AAC.1
MDCIGTCGSALPAIITTSGKLPSVRSATRTSQRPSQPPIHLQPPRHGDAPALAAQRTATTWRRKRP